MIAKRGQIETVTALILLGIFVSSVGAAYIWGVPLIEKRKSSAEINAADELMREIAAAIEEVARSEGTAQKTLNLNLKGQLTVDTSSQLIRYFIDSGNTAYPTTEVLLNDWLGPDNVGTIGSNAQGVISAKAEEVDKGRVRTTYTIRYRELVNPDTKEGSLIKLAAPRNNEAAVGAYSISIFREGASIENGASDLGGDLITTTASITIN